MQEFIGFIKSVVQIQRPIKKSLKTVLQVNQLIYSIYNSNTKSSIYSNKYSEIQFKLTFGKTMNECVLANVFHSLTSIVFLEQENVDIL